METTVAESEWHCPLNRLANSRNITQEFQRPFARATEGLTRFEHPRSRLHRILETFCLSHFINAHAINPSEKKRSGLVCGFAQVFKVGANDGEFHESTLCLYRRCDPNRIANLLAIRNTSSGL